MLDIIENDLLRKHLPNVSYLRLDGSVAANMRHEIVHSFNSDPSIDILLLTTQVNPTHESFTPALNAFDDVSGRRIGSELDWS
jgi:SNF2 family DNA or RNA helicase